MEYQVIRTDKADELIHRIILYVAEQFGKDVALEKLDITFFVARDIWF